MLEKYRECTVKSPLGLELTAYQEKAGVCSKDPLWICFHSCWMYTGGTIEELQQDILDWWEHDYRLVG